MNKKIVMMLCLLLVAVILSSEEKYGRLDPKPTQYSSKIEKLLISNGYKKVLDEDFKRNELFKEIYKKVYKKDYTEPLPSYCIHNFLIDGLYYEMLNSYEYKENPPLVTYTILMKKNKKIYYYKLNYNGDFELFKGEREKFCETGSVYEKVEFKVFY